MKKIAIILLIAITIGSLCGCKSNEQTVQVAATTLPVYEFSRLLCNNTDITVGQVVTESVSCLHDHTLKVSQMRMLESADVIVISGAGLEDFMSDALTGRNIIDASANTHQHEPSQTDGSHEHLSHSHEQDPHIWLSPENASQMAKNICTGLSAQYPQYTETFSENLNTVLEKLDQLEQYGRQTLSSLSCRELITFHDGFEYFAESFDLQILRSVEEEAGSEASAAVLKELITDVNEHQLPAVFIERNGSTRAASIIHAETGVPVYSLDMALSGNSYFDAMYHNINTVKEALE